jgi:hypothetical protein
MENEDSYILAAGEDFEAPKEYFGSFEDKLFDRIGKGGYVLESNIPAPFLAPKGYFEDLEQDVLDQTVNIKPSLQIVHKRNFAPWYRIAAAILVAGGFSMWYFGSSPRSSNQEVALSEISNAEILAYLEDQKLSSDELFAIVQEIDNPNPVDQAAEDELLDFLDPEMLNEI